MLRRRGFSIARNLHRTSIPKPSSKEAGQITFVERSPVGDVAAATSPHS
jgi:hypothetical protein